MKSSELDWMVTEIFMNGYNWIRIWNKPKGTNGWYWFRGFSYDLDILKKYEDKYNFKEPILMSRNIKFDVIDDKPLEVEIN